MAENPAKYVRLPEVIQIKGNESQNGNEEKNIINIKNVDSKTIKIIIVIGVLFLIGLIIVYLKEISQKKEIEKDVIRELKKKKR